MESITRIKIEKLEISPYNVRTVIDKKKIEDLMESIRRVGLLEPLIVMPEDGKYGIVIGRCRYEAIKLLKKKYRSDFQRHFSEGIPCIVRKLTPREAIILSLSENLQRGNLTKEEIGEAALRLQVEYGLTLEDIAESISVDVGIISEALSLYSFVSKGFEPARPGRPPKKKRKRKISKKARVTAEILTRKLERKGVLRAEEKEKFKEKFIRSVADLSGKEIERVAREIEELAEGRLFIEVEKVVKEIKTLETVERIVLFKKNIVEALDEIAEREDKSFDDVVNDLLQEKLNEMGLL